jgi:hypothetical protein
VWYCYVTWDSRKTTKSVGYSSESSARDAAAWVAQRHGVRVVEVVKQSERGTRYNNIGDY